MVVRVRHLLIIALLASAAEIIASVRTLESKLATAKASTRSQHGTVPTARPSASLPGPSPLPSPNNQDELHLPGKGYPWSFILWADEFDGTELDTESWNYFMGAAYGNELQYYTNRNDNVRVEDGNLVVEARAERLGGAGFTSGRVDTRLKRAFHPGMAVNGGKVLSKLRFEARMKLPTGQGLWPSFWLAPNSAACEACGPYGPWPYSGEIDILQAVNDMAYAFGTIHFGGLSTGGTFYNQGHWRPTSYSLAGEWHTYALEWSAAQMWWYVDDVLYFTTHSRSLSDEGWWTTSQTDAPAGPNAPFDAPFYVSLSLAIGGDWPGPPDAGTPLPAQLRVDYVRVLGL